MKVIKVGVFGLSRGATLSKNFLLNNAEVVALCDQDTTRLNNATKKYPSATLYTEFDEFIEHKGMDAVLICNFFSEHAGYSIKALERNIHVISECMSNVTMAEGVALVRAAEKSKAIYMLEENFPYMTFNREIKKICEGGTLGKILYAEGEYNHPFTPYELWYHKPFPKHWRNLIPATYYVTHSLAPLMHFTGATPKRITAMPVYAEFSKEDSFNGIYHHDRAAIMTTLNDDDSVFSFTGWASFGAHNDRYRVCGTNGQIENIPGTDGKIMLRYNDWQIPDGAEEINFYKPDLNDKDEELIRQSGHDGGDFIAIREFLNAIRENRKPLFDVYFATTCASVAILGHRSQMENGTPYDIPDFHLEEDRKKYENDTLSPFYGSDGSVPTISSSSRPIEINQQKIENYDNARKIASKEFSLS